MYSGRRKEEMVFHPFLSAFTLTFSFFFHYLFCFHSSPTVRLLERSKKDENKKVSRRDICTLKYITNFSFVSFSSVSFQIDANCVQRYSEAVSRKVEISLVVV